MIIDGRYSINKAFEKSKKNTSPPVKLIANSTAMRSTLHKMTPFVN